MNRHSTSMRNRSRRHSRLLGVELLEDRTAPGSLLLLAGDTLPAPAFALAEPFIDHRVLADTPVVPVGPADLRPRQGLERFSYLISAATSGRMRAADRRAESAALLRGPRERLSEGEFELGTSPLQARALSPRSDVLHLRNSATQRKERALFSHP